MFKVSEASTGRKDYVDLAIYKVCSLSK